MHFIDSFQEEATELLAELEYVLLELERRRDEELIARAFRAMHTLKGSGAMFGFTALSTLLHELESAFDRVRSGTLDLDAGLLAIAFDARDHMPTLIEKAHCTDEAHPVSVALLERLAAHVDAADAAGPTEAESPATSAPARARRVEIRLQPSTDTLEVGIDPLPVLRELSGLGDFRVKTDSRALPALTDLDPMEWHLAFTVELVTDRPRTDIEDTFMFVEGLWDIELREVDAEDPEPLSTGTGDVALENAPPAAQEAAGEPEVASRNADTVRVPAEKLDGLMDLVGEMVILQSQLKQLADDRDDMALSGVSEALEQLVLTMRDQTLGVRMVPIESAFQRFRRLVRDLSSKLGKQVDLVLEGGQTELDKTIIDRLVDPLVHLVRNAMDHGLEDPARRVAAGKPETGTLRIAASQIEGSVEILLEDDGAGIDIDRVSARALERGLIDTIDGLTDGDIAALIFEPGFSTAEAVSDLSGRGVGMDAARTVIEGLGGSIELSSERDHGTSMRISIPLTLAITEGMLVRVDKARYVLPLGSVEQCVELEVPADGDRSTSVIDLDGELVSQVDLRQWAQIENDRPDRQQVIVTATKGRRLGLVVDEVVGAQQTVIKPLGPAYAGIQGVSGATILGDGAVALILDVDAMAKTAA